MSWPAHMHALSRQTSRRARQRGFSNSSESRSGSGSVPASQSLSGFTSQSETESLRSASEYSSSVTDSSSESSDLAKDFEELSVTDELYIAADRSDLDPVT